MLWLLLAAARAEALTWWADSPEQAAALHAALPAAWPDAPVTIERSPPPPGADGLFLDDDALWLVQGDLLRRHDGHLDAYAAVALARSWSRAINAAPAPAPTPAQPPPPPTPTRASPAGVGWSFTAGPAGRRPGPSPAFHFAVQALSPHLMLSLEADPAERVILMEDGVRSGGGLLVRRLGATVGGRQSWPLSRDWQLEGALSVGGRAHFFEDISAAASSAAWLLPTASVRLRAWAPPSPPQRARLGGGLMVSIDGLDGPQPYPTAPSGQLRPLTIAAEVGLLRL